MTRPPGFLAEFSLEVPPGFTVPACHRDATCPELLRLALRRAVIELLRSDAPIRRADPDTEHVHRARVALRRLRSELRTLAPVVDPAWNRQTLAELRWLGAKLGDVRDADVLTPRLATHAALLPQEERHALDPLSRRLEKQRSEANDALQLALAGERYLALVERLIEAAQSPPLAHTAEAGRPARRLVRRRVRKAWRRLRRHVDALPQEPEPRSLHEVRKRAKHLHYSAALAAPLVGRDARRFARAIKRLQTALGDFHDASVAETWLRGQRDELDATGAFVAGMCAGRENERARTGRVAWRRAWHRARRKRTVRWLR